MATGTIDLGTSHSSSPVVVGGSGSIIGKRFTLDRDVTVTSLRSYSVGANSGGIVQIRRVSDGVLMCEAAPPAVADAWTSAAASATLLAGVIYSLQASDSLGKLGYVAVGSTHTHSGGDAIATFTDALYDAPSLSDLATSGAGNGDVYLGFAFSYNLPPAAPGVPTVTPNPVATSGTIAWTAGSDPDGDAISYDVDLARDGVTWVRIGTSVGALSLVHDFSAVAFSAVAKVRVRTKDTSGATSAWLQSSVFTINRTPTAPLLGFPSSGQIVSLDSTIRLSWTHSDSDSGDSQSKYDLRYRVVGAPAWTDLSATTTSQFRDFSAGTFVAGDYEWQVRTYDSLGTVGPYSASGFFTAAEGPDGPTITDPVNGGTVSSNPYTVTWSAAEQDAYQLRTVADLAGGPDTSTVYTDTGVVESATDRARAVGFATNGRDEHIQHRVRFDTLWSDWTSHAVDVSYTPPAAATLEVLAADTDAAISVAVTQPAPSGSEPAAAGYDLFRREIGGDSIRLAANRPFGSPYIDYTPASGVEYEYAVLTYGANGTSTMSAWYAGESTPDEVIYYGGGYA